MRVRRGHMTKLDFSFPHTQSSIHHYGFPINIGAYKVSAIALAVVSLKISYAVIVSDVKNDMHFKQYVEFMPSLSHKESYALVINKKLNDTAYLLTLKVLLYKMGVIDEKSDAGRF